VPFPSVLALNAQANRGLSMCGRPEPAELGVSFPFLRARVRFGVYSCADVWPGLRGNVGDGESGGGLFMNWKSKLVVGILTALVMFFLTFALPRGGPVRDAALAQFPMTVGVWAIFVLLFVKLK